MDMCGAEDFVPEPVEDSHSSNNDRPTSSGNTKIRAMAHMGVFTQVKKCENNWREKVDEFAEKTERKEKSNKESSQDKRDLLTMQRTERRIRIKKLFKESYRRNHPRRVILNFFNDVAREGAHDVEKKGKIKTPDCLHPLLRYFNRASVFTVWRPTSMDAMIRMIRCEAVGKGLDIKAKSAVRGKLSGLVPFLQIHGNDEKNKIKKLPKHGTVRVFFKREEEEEAAMVRAKAITILERVAHEILNMADLEKANLDLSEATDEESQALALEEINEINAKSADMAGYSISLIDDYAPSCYGLEIPMRLFWEAFIVRQDISREKGSIYDSGRESCSRNQYLNISAARYPKTKNSNDGESEHRVVILQTSGLESPMNPFELLMAYEMDASMEGMEVMPVASDCDCFLVGTRRVTYKTPMDPEQVEVMKWSISETNKILETTRQQPATNDDTTNWGKQWCGVLEKASAGGFEPKVPGIGFGDPKSCSIMENAVNRLIGSGSGGVRHGAECFNYHFPQDIEDEFIIIAESLPGDLPWMKVNLEELHDFLNEKISCSFTFPLNPKWILCDGGRWRDHYDKLMASDNKCTQESMNCWFPKDSGIREQIERIRTQYPNGFSSSSSGDGYPDIVTTGSTVSTSTSRSSTNRGFWSSLKKKKKQMISRRSSKIEAIPRRSSKIEAIPRRSSKIEAIPRRSSKIEAIPRRF